MLTALTTGFRLRLAVAFAAFAALCFVAPPAVLAFGHGPNTVECLSHADAVNHGMSKAIGAKHHGDDTSPANEHQMTCCGLFCLSALALYAAEVVDHVDAGLPLSQPLETGLLSRLPERLDRPPKSLLFV